MTSRQSSKRRQSPANRASTSTNTSPDVPARSFAKVATYSELDHAIQDQISEITLTDNIICPENILINYDLTINFNGHSLISDESTVSARLLDIRRGAVHLKGDGKVFAMGQRSIAIRIFGAISAGIPHYTSLEVDQGITLFAPDSYGILISPNLGVAYGLTIDFSGRILARDGICLPDTVHGRDLNPPVIALADGAVITADELCGTAITATGVGQWQIGHAELRGYTGLLLAHGSLDLRDTHIITSAPDKSSAFQLEAVSGEPDLDLTIHSGAYVSERSPVIAGEPATIKSFRIENGEFRSPRRRLPATFAKRITIDRANFASDVKTFLSQLPSIAPFTLTPEPAPSPEPDLPSVSASESFLTSPAALPDDRVLSESHSELACVSSSAESSRPTGSERSEQDTRNDGLARTCPQMSDTQVNSLAASKPPLDDLSASRIALSDALSEIRLLNPEDYEVGYSDLQAAIHQADLVLANASSTLVDIRDTAGQLLTAFDRLEERNELSLTDSELDALFYQGAVLEEISTASEATPSTPKPKSKSKRKSKKSLPSSSSDQPVFTAPITTQPAPNDSLLDAYAPQPQDLSQELLDFSQVSFLFQKVTELDLGSYTAASQAPLLAELDRVQPIIASPDTTQDIIDEITDRLAGYLDALQPIRNHNNIYYSNHHNPSAPAPLLGSLIPAAMFDSLEPEPIWSLGVTMIDELAPFVADEAIRRRLHRALHPAPPPPRQLY